MSNKHPNLLFVMTDDMGAWAMHCAGNNEIVTPNLDRLAKMGMRFDNLFCVSPVCSPARVSVYTGQIPSQHGVHDWLCKGHFDSQKVLSDELKEGFKMEPAPFEFMWPRVHLGNDHAIHYLRGNDAFTDFLAGAGYECGLAGKWHMGDSATPQASFSYWSTTANGAENYFYPVVYDQESEQMVLKRNYYTTDYIADRALNFLDVRKQDNPFCLAVHFTAPHSPWAEMCHPKEFYDLYRDCPFDSIPFEEIHKWVPHADQPFEEWKKKPHPGVRFVGANYAPIRETWYEYCRESQRGYYAAVSAMDHNLGRILDRLEADGLMDNTVIVFTSDNGSNMGHHGIVGKGNGTYPMNMYDTSVKVPGIFAWKGHIPAGVVSDTMVSHYDFLPTLLDLCGVAYDCPDRLPGQSFKQVLLGDTDTFREDVVVYDEYGPVRMIRTKEWKYVHRYMDYENELYDLVNDPGEKKNLIDDPAQQERIARMQAKLTTWFDKYVDPDLDGSKEDVRGGGQVHSHEFK